MVKPRWEVNADYKFKITLARQKLVDAMLGTNCSICKGTVNMAIHRKDGSKHAKFSWLTAEKTKQMLETGEYVRLCYPCHKGVHWAMEFLGLNWKEIEFKLPRSRGLDG